MDCFCPRRSLLVSSPPRPSFPRSFSARDLERARLGCSLSTGGCGIHWTLESAGVGLRLSEDFPLLPPLLARPGPSEPPGNWNRKEGSWHGGLHWMWSKGPLPVLSRHRPEVRPSPLPVGSARPKQTWPFGSHGHVQAQVLRVLCRRGPFKGAGWRAPL